MVFGLLLAFSGPPYAFGQTSPARLPITTNSPETAKLFDEGLHLSYDFRTEQALDKWREAAKTDPNFAQAWAYIVWDNRQGVALHGILYCERQG